MNILLFGIVGIIFIQWVVIMKLHSRLDTHFERLESHAEHLRRDKKTLNDIKIYGNQSLNRAFDGIDENKSQAEFLNDKIDTLLELLIQENEDSEE